MSGGNTWEGYKPTEDITLRKYITNLGIGMQGQKSFSDSLASGLAKAGEGYLGDLENERRKKLVQDVLGNGLENLNNKELTQKGLELIGSGDPSLAAIGQHLVTSVVGRTPTSEWKTTQIDIGGRLVPAQQNTMTGEIKPFSSDLILGPKATADYEMGVLRDDRGNIVGPIPGLTMPSQGTSSESNRPKATPVSQFTDTSINKPTTSVISGQTGLTPPANMPPGLTRKEQAAFNIQSAQNAQQEAQRVAAEARAEQSKIEEEKRKLAMTAPTEQAQVTGKSAGETDVKNKAINEQINLLEQNRDETFNVMKQASQGPVSGTLAGPLSQVQRAAQELGIKTDIGKKAMENVQANKQLDTIQNNLVASLDKTPGAQSDAEGRDLKSRIGKFADPSLTTEERQKIYDDLIKYQKSKLSSQGIEPQKPGTIVTKGGKQYKWTGTGYLPL